MTPSIKGKSQDLGRALGGLTHEQAHEALGVASLRDYGGTPAEANAAIERWIAANAEKTEG